MGSRHFGHQGKADANTKAIVDELRKHPDIGVRFIGKPVDLIVAYNGVTMLIEIKNPNGKDKRGESWERQQKFIASWPAPVLVCHTTDEVRAAIGYPRLVSPYDA